MANNTAVGSERVSKVVGYQIEPVDLSTSTPNLPQRIAILGEGNTANQATMPTEPVVVLNAQQAGTMFGFGSPAHMAMRILKPQSGDVVGGIPLTIYPILEEGSATNKIMTVTITGTATGNGTHSAIIAGRQLLDSGSYGYTVNTDDTATDVAAKLATSISGVVGSPFTAVAALGVVTLTSKFKGISAQDLTAAINIFGDGLGLTYAVAQTTAGAGVPTITPALLKFGSIWETIVLNPWNITVTSILDELETFNGVPGTSPTGRYTGIIMRPFLALTGSISDDDTDLTDARPNDVTIVACPAPLSQGMPLEAAANYVERLARQSQDNPHLDISGQVLRDMPTPLEIGSMADYNFRDAAIKKGSSTVELFDGNYRVVDFATTFHPTGELNPSFRFVRSLVQDFNFRFGYFLLEQINVVDHAIASNTDIVSATKVIKPKQWVAILRQYAVDLGDRGLIADVPFMQNNISVSISSTNPDRLNTQLTYKRSGYVRIASTLVQVGFNFG